MSDGMQYLCDHYELNEIQVYQRLIDTNEVYEQPAYIERNADYLIIAGECHR